MRSGICVASAWLVVAFLASSSLGVEFGIPVDGDDLVRLMDGRVVRCEVGEAKDGVVPLHFGRETLNVAKERIAEIRFFRDYDSTPRNDAEKEKVERGLVRYAGTWMDPERAEKMRARQLDKLRKAREEDEKHFLWESRWQITTKHYQIEANITGADLDYYVELLEAFYTHFTRSFKIKLTARERKAKLPVFLYREREQYWKRYQEDTGGEGENTNGYFVPVPGHEQLVLHARPGTREETKDVLLHEGTHYILHLANTQVILPRWVHEGCAEFFGASRVEGKKFTPGLVQDGRLLHFQEMIRLDRVLTFDSMMRAGNPAKEGDQIEFGGEHYAQAWTFVHFLFNYKGGKYRAGFVNYLSRWINGRGVKYQPITASDRKFIDPGDDATLLLRSLKHKDFTKLKAELVEYAKALPLRGAWAYVERGEMRYWNERRPDEAEKDFTQALERGGDDPHVLVSLARAYSRIAGKRSEVTGLLKRALELDPLDVNARYLLARRLPKKEQVTQLRICEAIESDNARVLGSLAWRIYVNLISGTHRATSAVDKKLAAEARAIAERAVLIDPEHSNYDTLSAMHILHGDFEKAREMAKRAVQQEPEGDGYLERLACTQAMLDDAKGCAKTMRRLEIVLKRDADGRELGRDGARRLYAGLEDIAKCAAAWDEVPLAVKAFDEWYRRRAPRVEIEWLLYAALVARDGDSDRALEIAKRGLEAMPDSKQLAEAVKALEG